MILRKPYAFFIKMFKPIHLILSVLIGYLIYKDNNIFLSLNNYIYSSNLKIDINLISNLLYVIPIIIILLSVLIMVVMVRKDKPVKFYIISIILLLVIMVINLYAISFFYNIDKSVISITKVKLVHDFILINIIIETILFVIYIVRGFGVNFKKFDFDNDIAKFDIDESDKEEFELNVNLDLNELKRKRKRKFRYLKYAYLENKFIVDLVVAISIFLIVLVVVFCVFINNKDKVEGVVYSANNFNFMVQDTTLLNTNYNGSKITNNYLIVVNTKLKSIYGNSSLFLKDFTLSIGDEVFKNTTNYSRDLIDLGIQYNKNSLSTEFTNYIFVFEIPKKYINEDMIFNYNNEGNNIGIKLSPKKLINKKISLNKNIGESISFENTIGSIEFKINNYDLQSKYILDYNYCIKDDDCFLSKEYLIPSIDKNYDKYILKLDVEYNNNSKLKLNSFYKFFSSFASIYYKIDDVWYKQTSGYEEIKSKKTNQSYVYIGVISDIARASSIKLVFDIRGSSYEYVLK